MVEIVILVLTWGSSALARAPAWLKKILDLVKGSKVARYLDDMATAAQGKKGKAVDAVRDRFEQAAKRPAEEGGAGKKSMPPEGGNKGKLKEDPDGKKKAADESSPGNGMANNEDVHNEDPGPRAGAGEPHMSPAICFPAGTLVSTAEGDRPIESIAAGDLVLSFDATTSSLVMARVTATPQGSTSSWVDVDLGAGVVRSTPSHPFWVPSKECWIPAGDLQPGMNVLRQDGSTLDVSSVSTVAVAAREPTYNLSVERTESYFVSSMHVLVHNITKSRFNFLSREGYFNYVLRDATGKIYYSGMFGGDQTPATVKARHSKNHNRFREKRPGNPKGDTFELLPGTRTYGEARIMEDDMAALYNTNKGKIGKDYRCNRQRPLSGDKRAEYLEYLEVKAGCG